MPYDGIVAAAAVYELSGLISGGRIDKIIQCESDEIILGCYAGRENYRLLLSANAANPRMHLTRQKKEAPLQAPPFCMVLRKYIQGGRIVSIEQSGYDRVVTFRIEHPNELGDYCIYSLIIEIMGKHSNIVLVNQSGIILDSIKHIDSSVNSFREVMPARTYTAPPPQVKCLPSDAASVSELFSETVLAESDRRTDKYILDHISGFSPLLCRSICQAAEVDYTLKISSLSPENTEALRETVRKVCHDITEHNFKPVMLMSESPNEYLPSVPNDIHCLSIVTGELTKTYNTVNLMLDEFYSSVDYTDRLLQKKSNVAKNISVALDRCRRKLAEQEETMQKCADYEDYKIKGELLTANLFQIKPGMETITVENYYTDPPCQTTIALNQDILPAAQGQKYFKQYRKAKSSYEQAMAHSNSTKAEIAYLENVRQMLDTCTLPAEISEVRQELKEQGYIKFDGMGRKKAKPDKRQKKAPGTKPLKFISADGFEIWVGKNNRQNDQLTCKTASGADIWFHVKNAPGSHVIIRAASVPGGKIPDSTVEEAAGIAAWYSSLRNSTSVEVDYTAVKNVKKPSGAKPGMVNYFNYNTINVRPLPKV